jgi:hypothetical protein
MIKINLLPAHVLERRRIRSAVVLVLVAVVIEAAVLGLVMMKMKAQVADEQAALTYWQGRAAQVGQVQSETGAVQGQAASFAKWKTWTDSINNYHSAWESTLADIARWIYKNMEVSSLTTSSGSVQIQGAVDNLQEFKTAYLNIYRSPLYTNVSFSISGVRGGWSQPAVTRAAPAAGAPSGPPAGMIGLSQDERDDQERIAALAARAQLQERPYEGRPPLTPPGAGPAAPTVVAALTPPIGVTFNCVLKSEVGGRLVPPSPPIGAGSVTAAGGAGAAPGAPSGPSVMQLPGLRETSGGQ